MDWVEYSRIVYENYKKAEKPYHACFELTPFCNFNCNMCFIHLNPEQAKEQGNPLNAEQWLDIAMKAKKMGTITVEITGGEPTTRPDFRYIYENLVKMGFLIHLRTNAYLVSGNVLDLLTRYKPRTVSVTLYGASDLTYRKVCGVPDGFSVVTQNVFSMIKAGINVRLTMTVTNDNVADVERIDRWAKKNNLTVTPFGALITPIRAAKRSVDHLQIELSEDEYRIPEEMQKCNRVVPDRQSLMNPFWMCRAFGAKFCISWDGRMTLCNTFTSIWTEPLVCGLEEAYHKLYTELRKLQRPEDCQLCNYIDFCAACPSKIQSATGDPRQTCDKICKMARRKFKHYMLHIAETSGDLKPLFDDRLDEGGTFDEN